MLVGVSEGWGIRVGSTGVAVRLTNAGVKVGVATGVSIRIICFSTSVGWESELFINQRSGPLNQLQDERITRLMHIRRKRTILEAIMPPEYQYSTLMVYLSCKKVR
jgi:hypothetical protein